jgi:hypothetical protein
VLTQRSSLRAMYSEASQKKRPHRLRGMRAAGERPARGKPWPSTQGDLRRGQHGMAARIASSLFPGKPRTNSPPGRPTDING